MLKNLTVRRQRRDVEEVSGLQRSQSWSIPQSAKEPGITNTTKDDVVIAVMGPAGSGKSTLIKCATSGYDVEEAGHAQGTSTSQVSAVRFLDKESKRHVVLVDTPGFDSTSKSDLDILRMISEWLVSSYNEERLLSGLLCLHQITDNRVAGVPLKNIRKLCGWDALDKVYLTTTMWDKVEPSVGESRLEELKTEYWNMLITLGAKVTRCKSDDDSPKKLIRQIISSECSSNESFEGTSPPPLESRQGLDSHPHEKANVSRKRTLMPYRPVDNRQSPQPQNADIQTHANIVIFGEAGVGKSSVINLIADKDVANTSRDAWGCTLESKQYALQMAKRTFNIWDTIGLGEPTFSVSNCLGAIEKTYALIREIEAKGGLDLLLFCIPGSRVTATMQSNYRLFFEVLCGKRIPIAVVVTRLEDEERMEEWWDRNEKYLSKGGLRFGGHACVTAQRGNPKAAEGRMALELLLLGYDHTGRYPMPPAAEWFSGFLKRLPNIPRPKELKDKQKELERSLRKCCGMDKADAQRLAEIITRHD